MIDSLNLPAITDEMTFFSFMSLTSVLNGQTGFQISKTLLGNGSAGTRLDFPSHLTNFCSNTAYAYGYPIDIALSHTVLPFYIAFRPSNFARECVQIMSGNSVETLKFKLGLPPAHLKDIAFLKYCPVCFEEDISSLGIGYWHRAHQLPSSQVCAKHSLALEEISLRENGADKNTLMLPSRHTPSVSICHGSTINQLFAISVISKNILHHNLPNGFNPKQLQNAYLHGLNQQGFLTKRGQIRASHFMLRLEQYFAHLKDIPVYERLLRSENIPYFLKLIRKPRGYYNPVAHVLLIQFLFGTWELFNSVYLWESQFQLDLDTEPVLQAIEIDDHLIEISQRHAAGESLSSLADIFEYDLGTLMRKLGKSGLVTINRRPKKLTQEILEQIEGLLDEGHQLKHIQNITSLSKATIDRVLCSHPDIKRQWETKRAERMRDAKRNELNALIEVNPEYSKSDIKMAISTAIKWLSSNDAQWLNQIYKSIPDKKVERIDHQKRQRIDWQKRDVECLSALRMLGHFELECWERLKPPIFLRRLPALSFTPRLEKLPQSKQWIYEELKHMENLRI